MCKTILSLFSALFFFLVSGCGGSANPPPETLVVYSAGPRGLAENICTAFTETTQIEVELFQATTGQILARLEAEKHRPRADLVLFASEVAAEALKREHRLQVYVPAEAAYLQKGWSDPDGFYHATGASLVGIAARRDAPPLPSSWQDLLSNLPEVSRIMPSPSRSGAAGDFTVAFLLTYPEAGWTWFEEARHSGLDFAAANSQAIGSLLMGAHDVIVAAADYLIYRQMAEGEAVKVIYPDEGAVLVTRPLAITASCSQPEAAKQFVDFYFSETAQQQVAEVYLIPGRVDVPVLAPRTQDLPELIRANAGDAVAQQAQLLRDFQQRVERGPRESAR
ncbi:extracellular solute-binding protein [Kiritimatiellaeota bacterium B1221]|nr:extracellular solute-binding protein [Kiritimatiellaeota bacterium B1221]